MYLFFQFWNKTTEGNVLLFNHKVMPDSLWPHGLQHARVLCPSLSPGVCSNSCPLSWWCYPTNLSFAVPFSFCFQSFLTSGPFQMNQHSLKLEKIEGGQNIGALVSTSVLPRNILCGFPLGLTGLISLKSKRVSRVFFSTTIEKHQFFSTESSLWSNSFVHTSLLGKSWLWLFGPL